MTDDLKKIHNSVAADIAMIRATAKHIHETRHELASAIKTMLTLMQEKGSMLEKLLADLSDDTPRPDHDAHDTTADPLADENTFAIKNPDIKLLKAGSIITFHHVPESLPARNKIIIGRLYRVEQRVEYGHMGGSPLIVDVSLGESDPDKPIPIDTIVCIDHLIDKATGCVMGVTLIKNPPS